MLKEIIQKDTINEYDNTISKEIKEIIKDLTIISKKDPKHKRNFSEFSKLLTTALNFKTTSGSNEGLFSKKFKKINYKISNTSDVESDVEFLVSKLAILISKVEYSYIDNGLIEFMNDVRDKMSAFKMWQL